MDVAALIDGIGDLGGSISLHSHGNEATCSISVGGVVYNGSAKRSSKELTMYSRAIVDAVHDMLRILEDSMAAYPEPSSDNDGDRQQAWFLSNLEESRAQAAIMWLVQFSGFKETNSFKAALGNYLNESGYWDQ